MITCVAVVRTRPPNCTLIRAMTSLVFFLFIGLIVAIIALALKRWLSHPSSFSRAARRLLIVGILLLAPGACTLVRPPLTTDDAGVAFTEVARIRLDSFRNPSSIRLVFSVPNTPQWQRLREAWGDHGYIVHAERNERSSVWIVPFSTLNLDVTVLRAGGTVAVQKASGCPYLISIASASDGRDCAMAFKPIPGEKLEITLTSRGAENLPAGDFVIQPSWGGYEKDRIVGAMIDSDLRPYLIGAAAIGIALVISSSILGIYAARRTP